MKWLVIFHILVIILNDPIRAQYEINIRPSPCSIKQTIQNQRERACIGEQLNESEFEFDANGTLWNYPGTAPMVYLVRVFAKKYCPALNRAIYCMRLRYNLPSVCISMFQKEENYLRTEILVEILKMFCADQGQKLLQVLQHDGLLTIYNNDIFFECFFLVEKYPFVDLSVYPYRMNREFCDGLQEAHECYINYVDLHANQDLWEIAGEAYTIARTMLNCEDGFQNQK